MPAISRSSTRKQLRKKIRADLQLKWNAATYSPMREDCDATFNKSRLQPPATIREDWAVPTINRSGLWPLATMGKDRDTNYRYQQKRYPPANMNDGRNGKHQQKGIVAISREGATQKEGIGDWLTVCVQPTSYQWGRSVRRRDSRLSKVASDQYTSHFESGTAATVRE
jgi:hypothetical protein